MKTASLASAAVAAAAMISMIACDRTEPTAVEMGPKPQSISQPSGDGWLGEGRIMTREEVDRLMEMKKNSPAVTLPAPSNATAPLAKTAAAGTCVMDFNSQSSLAALPDHGASTAILSYSQPCYNNPNVYILVTPYNLNHFHMDWEAGVVCFPGGLNWGTKNAAGACVNNIKDAMYWPRTAMNMNTNTAISINAVANGSYKKFNFEAFYVRSGTVRIATFNSGTWRYYGPCTAGQRWYMGSTTTVDQVIFFDSNNNGLISIDNVEAKVLY